MASVLKKLQAFVPTMDDTVGNLGAVPHVAIETVPSAPNPERQRDAPRSQTGIEEMDAPEPAEVEEAIVTAKPKPKPVRADKKKSYETLPGIPRMPNGAMDARALRRTGRTMQISLKVKPELPEAMKLAAYEQGIGLGALMEEMWDAYQQQRRIKRGP